MNDELLYFFSVIDQNYMYPVLPSVHMCIASPVLAAYNARV